MMKFRGCRFFFLVIFVALFSSSHAQTTSGRFETGEKWEKSDDVEYRIISGGSTKQVRVGDYMEMHTEQFYSGKKDSLLRDSRDGVPNFIMFDSSDALSGYFQILSQVRKGDSVIIRATTDNVRKKAKASMPDIYKSGHYFYTTIKIIDLLETKEALDSALKIETARATDVGIRINRNRERIEMDKKAIVDFLRKKSLKAKKTHWGTFVVTKVAGTGPQITSGNSVSVNYSVRSFQSGKVYDSNTDAAFSHTTPFVVDMSTPEKMITGFTDGLLELKSGSVADIYIPSTLAYGKQGHDMIPANEILIFHVEVLSVK